MNLNVLILVMFLVFILILACEKNPTEAEPTYPDVTREEKIPETAVKMSPETDPHPPVLHLDAWEDPVPLAGPVNTAGAEDSPFIPAGRDELYFFFTPDVRIPPEQQVLDDVTGIYMSKFHLVPKLRFGNPLDIKTLFLVTPQKLSQTRV